LGHLVGNFGKPGTLGRGEIVHLNALRFHADSGQGSFHIFDFTAGFKISFQEMTFTLQSPGHIDGIGAVFDGSQEMQNIHPAGAGHLDDFNAGGIIQPHGTSQIAGCVSTILAAEGDNLGLKGRTHSRLFLS
jgi:hypothetical protein